MPRRRAFTMIELLVVMGIIVLLIAILMPALGKAREAANSVTCSSHVKTLTHAFLLFASDHDGHLPGTRRTWRGNEHDKDHLDWLFGEYSAWDEYPGNTIVQRIDCAPQKGTLWKYVNNYDVYRCPSMNIEKPGTAIGSNGRFDYAAFAVFCGASIRNVAPISQLHRPTQNQYMQADDSGQTSTVVVNKPLPGPDMNDPNVLRDPMTPIYQLAGYAGIIDSLPTPLVCQEEPAYSINFDPGGNAFVHHDNADDDDWWSQMDGAHQLWDQMSHVHGGGSYYGAIDGSVVWLNEPDTDLVQGAWTNYPVGVYGMGTSLWWQKGPSTGRPQQLNRDRGAIPDPNNPTSSTWVSGWDNWSTR